MHPLKCPRIDDVVVVKGSNCDGVKHLGGVAEGAEGIWNRNEFLTFFVFETTTFVMVT